MKLYSFLGRLYFLIFIYISSTTWAFPFEKRSYSHLDLKYNRRKYIKEDLNINKYDGVKFLFNIKDTSRINGDITHQDVNSLNILPQEIRYTTTHKYSGNVIKHSDSEDVSLAEALTENSKVKPSSLNMVLPIAGTLTVLFSMSILVAIFQCCCRKRQTSSESEDVKTSNEKLVDSDKDSGNDDGTKEEDKLPAKSQGSDSEDKQVTSIKSKIKAFEGVIPTQPSPGPVRPIKKRPESNAFKALENKGIVYGVGKSPSRLSKTPEDENQNATETEEVLVPKIETTPADDDLGGYKQPDNPDVVIADVDENDEFSVIVRDTSVLRSHKRAPPPKNRNRSSAAVRRQRARETTTDLIFNDSSDNSGQLTIPDDLDSLNSSNKSSVCSNSSNSKGNDKVDSTDKNKPRSTSADRNRNKKENNDKDRKSPAPKREETPSIVTTDHSDNNVIDISKVPPEVFSGGNIFMHIDPTVKKTTVSEVKKPATPPTRLRSSQLTVEERKEKAKSTPLLSSHEDLAKALGKLKSPSKENTSEKTSGRNRSSSDLSTNTKM